MCAQVTPYGECLRGKNPPDQMLAKHWRRLFLAAYTLWAKPGCCCPAWQSVCCVIATLHARLLYCCLPCIRLSELS